MEGIKSYFLCQLEHVAKNVEGGRGVLANIKKGLIAVIALHSQSYLVENYPIHCY